MMEERVMSLFWICRESELTPAESMFAEEHSFDAITDPKTDETYVYHPKHWLAVKDGEDFTFRMDNIKFLALTPDAEMFAKLDFWKDGNIN